MKSAKMERVRDKVEGGKRGRENKMAERAEKHDGVGVGKKKPWRDARRREVQQLSS